MKLRSLRIDSRRPQMSWIDLGGYGKFKRWRLAGTEFLVLHCGHPTALWPWHGLRPDGSVILAGNDGVCGRAFKYLDDAKVACELESIGIRSAVCDAMPLQPGMVTR